MDFNEFGFSSDCYICKQCLFAQAHDVKRSTRYSRRPIFQIIETISGFPINNTSSCLCQNCAEMIESFDELHSRAMEVQEKLYKLMMPIQAHPAVMIKTEVIIKEEKFEDFENNTIIFKSNETNEKPIFWPNTDPPKRSKKESAKHSEVFKCEICFKNFDIKSKLVSHQTFHNTERNFLCPICKKTFKTKTCLRMHTRIHTNTTRVSCDHCDLSFTKKASFIRHYISLHTDRREFLCTHCPKAFSSMPTLRHHLFTHAEFKKEVCTICSGRFHTKTKLKRHMRTHADKKEFSCLLCGKEFTQKYNVNAHMKTVHSESRESKKEKFTCNICSLSYFKTLLQLRKHLAQAHEVINEAEIAT